MRFPLFRVSCDLPGSKLDLRRCSQRQICSQSFPPLESLVSGVNEIRRIGLGGASVEEDGVVSDRRSVSHVHKRTGDSERGSVSGAE